VARKFTRCHCRPKPIFTEAGRAYAVWHMLYRRPNVPNRLPRNRAAPVFRPPAACFATPSPRA
jgi:hypothetical protein